MATSSFFKHFVITDPDAIEALLEDYDKPQKVFIPQRDYEASSREGIALLKRQLLNLPKR